MRGEGVPEVHELEPAGPTIPVEHRPAFEGDAFVVHVQALGDDAEGGL